MKRWILVSMQMGLGLGLIAFLLTRAGGLAGVGVALRAAGANWPWVALAVVITLFCILCCAIRWQMLLAMQGLKLRFAKTFALYLIGQFFSALLPGATSGDLVKAYYAARETHHRKTEAIATVFIDRIIGLLALILFVVAVLAWRFRVIWNMPQTRVLAIVYVAMLAVSVVGVAFIVWNRRSGGTSASATGWRQQALRAYEALGQSLSSPGTLTVMLALSVVNHVAFVVAEYALAKAVGAPLSLADCLTVFPVINAAGTVPLAPGGLGTRDAAAVMLLGLVGVVAAQAMSISLLVYGVMILFSLVGGFVFLAYAPAGAWRNAGKDDPERIL